MEHSDPPWLSGISGDDARRLIASDEPLLRVVAGPGAGKTTCLKRRVRRLIEGEGVTPESIFVGTFTRAIARELREELGRDIKVLTLHSLAYELLRANPAACQGMELRFLLAYEEDAMLYDIADQIPSASTQAQRRAHLRRLQSARAEREEYHDATFAGAVRNWLQRHRAMLIGEVVHLAVVGLESYDIQPGQFDHVVVDEYQDLTAAEQDLVELIWSRNGSLVVMGDNDQSIYSFRFNHPSGIDEFPARWEEYGVTDLSFPYNRRCGSDILHLANLMMAEAGTKKDPMSPASGRVGQRHLVHWPGVRNEVEGLSSYITSKPDESFLVLVPRRFIGYRLSESIGPDAQTAFQEQVLERPLAQERFALASVLANPDDPVAVRSWLGFHGTLSQQASRRNSAAYVNLALPTSRRDLIPALANQDLIPSGSGSTHVRRRAEILHTLMERGLPEDIHELIDFLFDPTLADEPEPEKQRWLEADLTTLRDASHSLASDLSDPSLAKIVQRLRYRIATRATLGREHEEPRIRIMTLHSAKGLEGDNIVLAGVADQFIPGFTDDPDVVAEQRRLLYVAVTRARDRLIVSWPRAMSYADAVANNVRKDYVLTIEGETSVRLSRSTLLPQSLPGGELGPDWLRRAI